MLNIRIILSLLILFFYNFTYSNSKVRYTIIENQYQFERAIDEINTGKEVRIKLHPGVYYLTEDIRATAPISIVGNKATIVGNVDVFSTDGIYGQTETHYIYRLNERLNPFCLFVDEKDNIIEVSESVDNILGINTTHYTIEGMNPTQKGSIVKLPIPENLAYLRNKKFSGAFGYIDCGWAKLAINVDSADKKNFYCRTLESTNVPDINYDRNIYKKDIRYVIYNAELKPSSIFYDDQYLYVPKEFNNLVCLNSDIYNNTNPSIKAESDIVIDGVTFKNFRGIQIASYTDNVCNISNCSFLNVLGDALTIKRKYINNVRVANINNCKFRDCALANGYIVSMYNNQCFANCFNFVDNIVCKYSKNRTTYKNTFGAIYVNANARIIDNEIFNNIRSHIFSYKGKITIEKNRIYNTASFNEHKQRNLSNDFGLIYCGYIHKNTERAIEDTINNIHIKGNLLYGAYAYANDARGIMIDDGRGNVTCKDNLILDTQKYSIDSREVPSFIGSSSIRNIVSGNYVDNGYRLQGGKEIPQSELPIADSNILLKEVNNSTNNINAKSKDISISSLDSIVLNKGCVYVTKNTYKKLKKQCGFNNIKKFIKTVR